MTQDLDKIAKDAFCNLHPDVIEWAKSHYNSFSEDDKKFWEGLIPELVESEDEKIRKNLIDFLKSPFVNENITDEKVTPWIAWLEKQKEPTLSEKPKWSEEDKRMIEEVDETLFMSESGVHEAVKKMIDGERQWLNELPSRFKSLPRVAISEEALREGIGHYGITQHQIDNWLKKYIIFVKK